MIFKLVLFKNGIIAQQKLLDIKSTDKTSQRPAASHLTLTFVIFFVSPAKTDEVLKAKVAKREEEARKKEDQGKCVCVCLLMNS